MGSTCLSVAPILRCAPLNQLQNIVLIIPVGLEVLLATSLVYFNWGFGRYVMEQSVVIRVSKTIFFYRRYLLLTAEGWIYFTLALFELVSNVLPSIRNNVSLFRAFDVFIGSYNFWTRIEHVLKS